MPAFTAILIPHLMLGDTAVIMVALFAMGLMSAGGRPAVVMGFRGLRAAGADALVGGIVHIRPNVVVGGFILPFRTPRTGVIVDVAVDRPFGLPVVAQGAAVFMPASFADGAISTGISAVMVFPDIASGCRMYATRVGA
jgi:hypothetical protein